MTAQCQLAMSALLLCACRVAFGLSFRAGKSLSRSRLPAFTPVAARHQQRVRPPDFSALRFSTTAAKTDANKGSRQEENACLDSSNPFEVTAEFPPTGDQPEAIEALLSRIQGGDQFSVLRGITGTGKTLVMSHLIARIGQPTLVLCHNKTLAAQLARELRSFLGKNAVELFVSYYNHYVPESFSETTGKYIAKKSSVNADIDVLRHRATRALLTRKDVVVVASVSCIYGLGLPKEYLNASTELRVGDDITWDSLILQLDRMLFDHVTDDDDFIRGCYQYSEGDGRQTISLWPPHEQFPMQVDLEEIEPTSQGGRMCRVLAIYEGHERGIVPVRFARIFPAKHHVMSEDRLEDACIAIENELRLRTKELHGAEKFTEADRLQKRVVNDLMMLRETGFCSGGENYSAHFAGRAAGQPPDTLLDYFQLHGDWLLMVDESHVTLSQLRAMYGGDQARKRRLIQYGYRLPSALDNRPLREEEFWDRIQKALFVSATPSKRELDWANRNPVDMVIRPTFVCDPTIEVRPPSGQLQNLLEEVALRVKRKERTLAVAITKRDAEDLSTYLNENGVCSAYIHSGLTTHERSDVIKALQTGDVECLVGVNLLREGLDLPQVSLVAVLNADSEGFLRSETALLQMVGRAARNVNGSAVFYANRITDSMRKCINITNRRREKQLAYNAVSGATPKSTKGSSTLSIFDLLQDQIKAEHPLEVVGRGSEQNGPTIPSSVATVEVKSEQGTFIMTDHIPTSPGVYLWKSGDNILYIGKARRLRSRVKSYLSPKARHSPRIKIMLQKAESVEFMLTPSERDALVLESNLIKHHQPPFNVLLKDDEHYPYICASVGDSFPRFSIVPRRHDRMPANSSYRYFGPYTNFKEINAIIDGIEEKYDLRAKSFLARHGSLPKAEYNGLFKKALDEVFGEGRTKRHGEALSHLRLQYEEAGLLFDSKKNRCRDVVAIEPLQEVQGGAVVLVVQLREGVVAGHFSYTCLVPSGLYGEEDLATTVNTVLEERHYPSGGESAAGSFTWFPDEVLLPHEPVQNNNLRAIIRQRRSEVEPERKSPVVVRAAAKSGSCREIDRKALEFACNNVKQVALEKSLLDSVGSATSSVDGTAARELASLLALGQEPRRIECYDISHTQGEFAVGSRVVFIDGRPAPHLYRQFNIRSINGVDDYASLEEVLERRFRRSKVNGTEVGKEDPWALPDMVLIDGGPGQLNAALKGMSKANIAPLLDEATFANSTIGTSRGQRSGVALCALAKNKEELFIHGRKGPVNEGPDSPALLLLRSLRDESHRFALSAHRRRRSVRNYSS